MVQALTAHLAADSSHPPGALAADSSGLAEQLAAIEQRLLALEQAQMPSPNPVAVASAPVLAPPIDPLGQGLPDRRLTAAEADGVMTLPEVAKLLGLGGGGSAITNWIGKEARKNDGTPPIGATYRGGFQLLGKGLLPNGLKAGWLFRAI